MNPIDGRVQTLSMRAPDEATWQRVATLVEEAIRTAALDAELPGRLFVVRELDIGTIARAVSPQNLALVIEGAVEQVTSRAVSADDHAAGVAPMIYFKDDASVVLSLAQRVASGKPATEWFWPSVVKGWTPSTPTDRAIPLLIERAMSTAGGVVTLAQVVDTLASTGALDKLLERLTPADGRALLETIGWTEAMVRVATTEETNAHALTPQMPARAQSLVQQWVARWNSDRRDPRAVWLGAMLLVADHPARAAGAAGAELPELVRRWLASVVARSAVGADDDMGNDVVTQAMRREDLIVDAHAWLQSHPRSPLDSLFGGGPPRPLVPSDSTVNPTPVERRSPDDESRVHDRPTDESPAWKTPRQTNHAGFLFLAPLLTRVGVTNIVTNDSGLIDRDWPTALLLRLARRLGISHDDAAVAWIASRPVTIAHVDRPLTAEVMRAARIRLRMETGLTLRRLVRHSGAIVAARASIDVFLHHAVAETSVRRAGLGDDSEFVPWLGRAVQFHYLDAIDVSA